MSVFYKIDARVKLLYILLFTTLVFMVDKLPVAVCVLLSFIAVRIAAKVPFCRIKFLKKLALLMIFIVLMQTLFGPGNSYIVKPLFPGSFPLLGGAGSLKWEGFILGLVIVCRLAALFVILPVFTETTEPFKIAQALYSLGFNYRIAFIITFAFNLIPFFKDEALSILDAQKLRGMRSLGIKTYTGLLVPLMLGAMRKAQSSSAAMDSRAFGVYNTRTWTAVLKLKTCDFWFIAGSIVFFAGMIIFNFAWK